MAPERSTTVSDALDGRPVQRMPLTLMNTLLRDHRKFDINLNRDFFGAEPVFVTQVQLDRYATAQHDHAAPCEMCHLPVQLWGLALYTFDDNGVPIPLCHICKACWPYSEHNWYKLDSPAPPCDCPPGAVAGEKINSGCKLHISFRSIVRRKDSHATRWEIDDMIDAHRKVRQTTFDKYLAACALTDAASEHESSACKASEEALKAADNAAQKDLEAVTALEALFNVTRFEDFEMKFLRPSQHHSAERPIGLGPSGPLAGTSRNQSRTAKNARKTTRPDPYAAAKAKKLEQKFHAYSEYSVRHSGSVESADKQHTNNRYGTNMAILYKGVFSKQQFGQGRSCYAQVESIQIRMCYAPRQTMDNNRYETDMLFTTVDTWIIGQHVIKKGWMHPRLCIQGCGGCVHGDGGCIHGYVGASTVMVGASTVMVGASTAMWVHPRLCGCIHGDGGCTHAFLGGRIHGDGGCTHAFLGGRIHGDGGCTHAFLGGRVHVDGGCIHGDGGPYGKKPEFVVMCKGVFNAQTGPKMPARGRKNPILKGIQPYRPRCSPNQPKNGPRTAAKKTDHSGLRVARELPVYNEQKTPRKWAPVQPQMPNFFPARATKCAPNGPKTRFFPVRATRGRWSYLRLLLVCKNAQEMAPAQPKIPNFFPPRRGVTRDAVGAPTAKTMGAPTQTFVHDVAYIMETVEQKHKNIDVTARMDQARIKRAELQALGRHDDET
ncbi:hypothetical protein C8R43DRAFT_952947 [Mycena crocata]|nr:hypothetical protein C8R43DRAFT_952947 [Mycena crocata]